MGNAKRLAKSWWQVAMRLEQQTGPFGVGAAGWPCFGPSAFRARNKGAARSWLQVQARRPVEWKGATEQPGEADLSEWSKCSPFMAHHRPPSAHAVTVQPQEELGRGK
jgi:hypothetical protein